MMCVRLAACAFILCGLAACDRPQDSSPNKEEQTSTSEGFCLQADEKVKLARNPDVAALERLFNDTTFCGDGRDADKWLEELIARGDTNAMRTMARRTAAPGPVVPLLRRAAELGNKAAAQDLVDMAITRAVAESFGAGGIDATVEIAVPEKFLRPTGREFQALCSSTASDDMAFCEMALRQLASDDDRSRDQVFTNFMPTTVRLLKSAEVAPKESAQALYERVSGCA